MEGGKKFWMFVVLAFGLINSCTDNKEPVPVTATAEKSVTPDPPPQDTVNEMSVLEYKVLAHTTDSLIRASDEPHFAYLATGIALRNKLLLFLGGTNTAPKYFIGFPKAAASLGYHVVNIEYPNGVTVRACEDESDMKCFNEYHEEIIFGKDVSPFVEVDEHNSIANRVLALLQHLHAEHPGEGWNQYYSGSSLKWSAMAVAGHSQGGDHAAYIAYKHSIDRLIVMCSPNDYSKKYNRPAAWCREAFATPASKFYGLMHKRDELVPPSEHYETWRDMRLVNESDTSSADKNTYKDFRALYTDVEPNPKADKYKSRHNAPVIDEAVPSGPEGEQLKKVWVHLLSGN
jgi:hypothetical protein